MRWGPAMLICALALASAGLSAGCDDSEVCDNFLDDDGDGLVDCADPDCRPSETCIVGEAICDDGLDDDEDGLIDCADVDCHDQDACSGDGG